MNIWHYDLSDSRSVRLRFVLSLVHSFVVLLGSWLLTRSVALIVLLAVTFCYWSTVSMIIDRWRLSHPDAPRGRERFLRLLAIQPVLLGIPVTIHLWYEAA